jgi:hypothetical protein
VLITLYTFVKDDINLPWNDIIFTLESESYETNDNNNEERFENTVAAGVKQSKSVDNLIGHLPLPAPEDVISIADDDCFPAGKSII